LYVMNRGWDLGLESGSGFRYLQPTVRTINTQHTTQRAAKPITITREISQADKRTFCQFRDAEYPQDHIARSWCIHSPPKPTITALCALVRAKN
jgi:hypothetical protein